MAASDITVSGLTAVGDVKGVKLAWAYNDPRSGNLRNISLDVVEVWAATSNDRAHASFVKVGEGITDFLHAGLSRGASYYYWIRARDRIGGYGEWHPSGATAGVVGTEVSGDVSLSENGYWKHPSGLIEQWGRDDLTGGGSTTVDFPIQFPNQCRQVIASPLTIPSTTIMYTIAVETFDVNGVNLTPNRFTAGVVDSPAMTVLWRANGY